MKKRMIWGWREWEKEWREMEKGEISFLKVWDLASSEGGFLILGFRVGGLNYRDKGGVCIYRGV